jgi:hypothetical protein
MAVGISSKGTTGETGTTSTRAPMAESDEPRTEPDRRETDDKTQDKSEEVCAAATMGHISEGKPLILLQANSRNICNIILEFWNLIDTYKPDVVIGTE